MKNRHFIMLAFCLFCYIANTQTNIFGLLSAFSIIAIIFLYDKRTVLPIKDFLKSYTPDEFITLCTQELAKNEWIKDCTFMISNQGVEFLSLNSETFLHSGYYDYKQESKESTSTLLIEQNIKLSDVYTLLNKLTKEAGYVDGEVSKDLRYVKSGLDRTKELKEKQEQFERMLVERFQN